MRTPDEHLHTSRITHHASQEEQGNRVFGTDIEFAYPWVLAGLIAVPLLWLVAARLRPERLRGGAVLSTLGPLVRIGPGGRARWRRVLLPLRLLGLALLVVAL